MLRDGLLNWRDFLLTLMHGTLAGRPRTFADLINFLIVHVCQHLAGIALVEIRPADRAIAEMIGLGFCDVIGFETAADEADRRSSSGSNA
jgi:hypothetical protein